MFVVIVSTVSTVSTGRVRRKQFAIHEKAQKYADRWRAEGRRYYVEVTEAPAARAEEAPVALLLPSSPRRAA
jgi:hypothetical protein